MAWQFSTSWQETWVNGETFLTFWPLGNWLVTFPIIHSPLRCCQTICMQVIVFFHLHPFPRFKNLFFSFFYSLFICRFIFVVRFPLTFVFTSHINTYTQLNVQIKKEILRARVLVELWRLNFRFLKLGVCIYPTLLSRIGCATRSIFKEDNADLNSKFSFS